MPKFLFEDGIMYNVATVAQTELGILADEHERLVGLELAQSEMPPLVYRACSQLLELRYGDFVNLEFGPGRGKMKRPHATIGLNPSADPKSDIYWNLERGIPLLDETVGECFGNQFLEHLGGERRIHFMNDLWRVMKPGATARFCVPHWQSPAAAGDPTHAWPPFTETSFQYFCQRADGTPFVDNFSDYGIRCNFELLRHDVKPRVLIDVELRKPHG